MAIASYGNLRTTTEGDADRLIILASTLTLAIGAADRLNPDAAVLSAALEFAAAHLPEFAAGRADPSYVRPDWLSVSSVGCEDTEEFVDGQWQPVNPRWKGLPGDKSADLELLASLRERQAQTVAALADLLNLNAATVRVRLKKLEQEGLVSKQGVNPTRWRISAAVLDSS